MWWTWGPAPVRMAAGWSSQGTPAQIEADPASLTGAYLSGRERIAVPARRRSATGGNGSRSAARAAITCTTSTVATADRDC